MLPTPVSTCWAWQWARHSTDSWQISESLVCTKNCNKSIILFYIKKIVGDHYFSLFDRYVSRITLAILSGSICHILHHLACILKGVEHFEPI